MYICYTGFSRYSSVVAWLNLHVGGQETALQCLTAHTLSRCDQSNKNPPQPADKKQTNDKVYYLKLNTL